ncbi:NADH dehydrogenase [ubiquinone] iron-sulfur protein 6, mitochondrial [Trachymyrmex septentrionalis]|uniref:NADH dehydrogenase [ubiquinone] iron-sulfur protein 6, mitochondrial n=1 Tax=Trachymyrmex septentrionalis TaxID=34720 RepID=A0A195FW77_9HYME|nr:PREDICTED: NADH dehydrogenase [ubiquinone] iron-sulfur protein 6, mitochondrial [Trachymyrmex septentrionalis]KYN44572.1 NADH dehydrogenase [ubiquinone] iron-sulfur protein 6, mitochondrial [Trachymyrmex septentrionalis]
MATKKINGLFVPFNQLYKRNVFMVDAITKHTYATTDEVDQVTHTGQAFEKDDYRLVRFLNRPKEVNKNWAIKLIDEVPPSPEKDRIVACDGGGGPLGHPKVYINLDKPGNHICGYCGLRFYKENH